MYGATADNNPFLIKRIVQKLTSVNQVQRFRTGSNGRL